MAKETYIKLFRRLLKWGWYSDTNTFRVFMHILLNAQYTASEYKGYTLQPGDCVFGRKKWAKELGLSEQQVRTAIEHLKSTNEITMLSTNKFSVVSVVNWELWQVNEGVINQQGSRQDNQQSTNNQPTSNQQVTTFKESKNSNKVKKKDCSSYTNVWQQLSSDQIDHLYDMYDDAGDLIQAVYEDVKSKGKQIDDALAYIVGYAREVRWNENN